MSSDADDQQSDKQNDDKASDKAIDKESDARERARALLEATHSFPCEYFLMVIARSDESITERLVAAVNRATAKAFEATGNDLLLRPSAGGKYVSHRFSVQVEHADEVLRLYEVVKSVEGVVTVM